jgi:RND superfamily putative drug exporter
MIFAAPMLAMLFSSIGSMVQGGFIIGVGLLVDTFIVRTITVPALAVLVGNANWWPSGRSRKPRSAQRPSKWLTSLQATIRARLPKRPAIAEPQG